MTVVFKAKSYTLAFEHRPGYLYVHLGARANTYETAKQYWTEILAMLHRRRYTRVLIEKEVSEKLLPHDISRLVSELAHSGYSNIAFAIFDRDYEEQRAAFYELVAANRGITIKVVDNLAEAESWLSRTYSTPRMIVPVRTPARLCLAAA